MSKYCWWEFDYLDKNKWNVNTSCESEFVMTRDNKYGKLYKRASEPHPCGTELGVKCPHCSKGIRWSVYD